MLVLIIHLKRAAHRRAHVEQLGFRLRSLPDLDVQVLDAVDGQNLTPDQAKSVQPNLCQPAYPFALSPGEVGCFLSHRAAWQLLLDSDQETCLILEDDVLMDDLSFLEPLEASHPKGAFVQLPALPPRNWPENAAGLQSLAPPSLRTPAQILDRSAAADLLAQSQHFDRPVDAFLQMTWWHRVAVKTLYPTGISLLESASTIQAKKKSWRSEVTRSLRRSLYRARIRNLARTKGKV